MQIKHALGKLPLPAGVHEIAGPWLHALAASLLPIEVVHLGAVYALPNHHRDPFDRILVAQALTEGMHLVSGDTALSAYGISRLW